MMKVKAKEGSIIRFIGEDVKYSVECLERSNNSDVSVFLKNQETGVLEKSPRLTLKALNKMRIAEIDGFTVRWEVPIIDINGNKDIQDIIKDESCSTFESAVELTARYLNEYWRVDREELAKVMPQEEPETSYMKCPICDSDNMYYAKVEKGLDGAGEMEYTHAWSCEDCPCIVFEYNDKKDINNLEKMNYNYCGALDIGVYVDIIPQEWEVGSNIHKLVEKYGLNGHKIVHQKCDNGRNMYEVEFSHSGDKYTFTENEIKLEGANEDE